MRNKIISFCLIALLIASLSVTAFASNLDLTKLGSIRVSLFEKSEGTPIVGAELAIYHVATVELNGAGNLSYTYTPQFEACGVSLKDPELTQKLEQFVNTYSVFSMNTVTDSQGVATLTDIPLGLYFVKQINSVEGFAPCKPFLVTVPFFDGNVYNYDVEATPKTEVAKLTDITIKKVWNTDESSEIPESVTVQLLQNGEILKTASLSEQNNWQVTFSDMPESDGYSVEEIDVPKGFTATYSQNGYVFTVTNTAALIQTGQLIWPIPAFAVLGIALLLAGARILRKEKS